jgi:8-oxo-dGTP pyrophosphatase MutT (NUDIX family)
VSTDPAAAAAPFSFDDFCARAQHRLLPAPPDFAAVETIPALGEHSLDPARAQTARPLRPAAVLIPVVARAEPTVLLTQRTPNLSSHAGQIAFPGGKVDPADTSPLVTALREAEEEIGLLRRQVTPLGYLDLFVTGTGYRIVPVVATVAPEIALTLNAQEVADAFEVPLAFLMTPANHLRHSRLIEGRERHYHAMPWGERYIWGATAAMLKSLYGRLYG